MPPPSLPLFHIGAHMSRTNGYRRMFAEATRIGANVVQVFAGNPRRLRRVYEETLRQPERLEDLLAAREWTTPEAPRSRARVRLFCHSPYLINLSNPDPAKMRLHAEVLRQELEVCERAGGEGVVVHTGKRKVADGQTDESAYTSFVRTVQMALANFRGRARVLLETSAGEGNSVGVTVEDFARLYLRSGFSAVERRDRLGLVIDTCHVFGAGYDLTTAPQAHAFLHALHDVHRVPRSHVKLVHLNDSKGALGSCTDFHASLGEGLLFANGRYAGLAALMRAYVPRGVPFVLETHDARPYAVFEREIALCRRLWRRCQEEAYGEVGDAAVVELVRVRATRPAKGRRREHRPAASVPNSSGVEDSRSGRGHGRGRGRGAEPRRTQRATASGASGTMVVSRLGARGHMPL